MTNKVWDLVADIGGTTMRVAQVIEGNIVRRHDFKMDPDRSVPDNLVTFMAGLKGLPKAVVCAGAGPLIDGQIRLTNGGWLLSEPDIAAATGAQKVHVINDFEAAAWSLATVQDKDVTAIGDAQPLRHGHRVALGPGTGLGAGALIWDGAAYRVVPGEGGHVGIGPRTSEEVPIFERFGALWPETRFSGTFTFEAEAMLSGTGLPFLYQAAGGEPCVKAADVFARASLGEPAALKTVDIFRTHLAVVAGNLAVTLRATGGIFLVGGVAQANPGMFDNMFWDIFSAGGRFSELRKECGIYLINIEDFGLRGCVNALMSKQGAMAPHA
ncbi:MAG: ROK family protein [Aliishimia sp.]